MNALTNPRGGAPVGHLVHLGSVEQAAVRLLRAWSNGADTLGEVIEIFRADLGPTRAELIRDALCQLCELCCRHGRRPLMCHHTSCSCLGADESCFAHFIANATEGRREDALLMATLLVRADCVLHLLTHAETLGRALSLYCVQAAPRPTETPTILH
ncbi:hypothetical protein I5535_09515 [Rhodobacteraceae bacterium F11138]|nr:hypothetical protein [Rhodobacteraceae bacterium F11138]